MTTEKDNLRTSIKEAIDSQKRPTVTVLSSLLAIQDSIGYIPEEAIEEVAVHSNTSINSVFGVASFYPNFRFTPPGKHSVEVCWGPTCHLKGSTEILEAVIAKLGLESEGDTEDGKVSFRFNTCLGACSQAPVLSVDHELYGNANSAMADKLIGDLDQKETTR
ncbi:MAG: NAD(P)H-dependent oxidoreductase subunit E [Chloroflexota bacterium]|nr:NAD(P)H-dependent oxidoreductase subunit E [Chloroflexota bacterium]